MPQRLAPLLIFAQRTVLAVLVVVAMSQPAFAACSSPSGSEGQLMYNSTSHVAQFCDGTNWILAGGSCGSYSETDPQVGSLTANLLCTGGGSSTVTCATSTINLATQVTGNLSVNRLNSG